MAQVDRSEGLVGNTFGKAPCRLATTANIATMNGLLTIDGTVTVAGDRVLVKDQTNAVDNGIWVADTGDWTRAVDCDGPYDISDGTMVSVFAGVTNVNTVWRVNSDDVIVIGTDDIDWENALFGDANVLNFLQGGTGGTLRTAQNKMREIISVKDFGAVGDGTTDDKAAIQLAINYAATFTNGAAVLFPPGTYKLSAGLTCVNPLLLYGAGAVLAAAFGTGDVLQVAVGSVDNAFIADGLTFKPSVTRTANYDINLVSCSHCHVYNCSFISGYHGVGITGAGANNIHLDHLRFQSMVGNNIDVIAASGTQGCVDTSISHVLMAGASVGSQSLIGINVTSAGDLTLEHVSTVYCATGLNVVPASGASVQALFMSDVFFDTGSGTGIIAGGTGTGFVGLIKGSNVWSCSNTVNGITLGGGTGTILQTDLLNVTASGNTGTGILIAANATNTTLIGGSASQNGTHGVGAAANASKFKIIGMNIGQSEGLNGNGGWGILVNAGTSDNYIIEDNYLAGNTSGQLSDGGTGTAKVIRGNLPSSIQVWDTYAPTVTLVGGAGNTVPVYTTNTGRYRRIDNTVHVQVLLSGDGGAEGAGSGALTVALPIAGKAVYKSCMGRGLNNATLYPLNGDIAASASVVTLEYWSSVTATATFDGDKQNNATRKIEFSFTYEAA